MISFLGTYPKLPGEIRVVDEHEPYGRSSRYGVLPNTGVNYEDGGQMWAFYLNCALPGVKGKQLPGRYVGHNMAAWENDVTIDVDGVESTGIVHVTGGGTAATLAGTMTAGVLTAVSVVTPGEMYFHPPVVTAFSASGVAFLNGVKLTPVMTATYIKVLDSLPCHAANDLLTLQNGVVAKVLTVDADGRILTVEIHTASSTLDPTLDSYGSRYYSGSSPEAATAWFLVGFSVLSVTIDQGGSGGIATVTVLAEPPSFYRHVREGSEVLYGRLGVQGAKQYRFGHVRAKDDPSISFDHIGQPGAHYDWSSEGYCESYIVEKTTQTGDEDRNAWAALSVDGANQPNRIRFGLVQIDNAAFHAAALSADVSIDILRIGSFGQADELTAIQEFGPSGMTRAAGLFCWRGVPQIGLLEISQNESLMGDAAFYHANILSTGLLSPGSGVPPHNPENPDSMTENVTVRPATIGNVILRNVCRGGFQCVDPDFVDLGNPCNITVAGLVSVQYSAVEPMAAGFLARSHGGTSYDLDHFGISLNQSNRSCSFSVQSIKFFSADGARIAASANAPNHLYVSPCWNTGRLDIDVPLHSNSITALLENAPRGVISQASQSDAGMPFSGALPLVWLKNGLPNFDLDIFADCTTLAQSRPTLWVDNPVGGKVGLRQANYRTVPLVVLTTPVDFEWKHCVILGRGGGETGLLLVGAQAGTGYRGVDIQNCNIGIGVSSATFDATCYGLGNKCAGNATNTQIPNAALPTLACSNFTL